METMLISQLAERSGVAVTTLRFYERAGLVPAGRSASGYRLYRHDALERLEFIAAAKQLGLPLEEIAELLDVRKSGACAQVKAELRPRLAARLAEVRARRAEADGLIEALYGALAHLDRLPDRDERCDPRCGLPADRPAVACSLRPGEFQERTAQWNEVLAGGERRIRPEGMTVSVPAARAGRLAALCVEEQRCCPFFAFILRFDGPLLHLEVHAPPEARELLEQLGA